MEEVRMIARIWRGATRAEDAEAYLALSAPRMVFNLPRRRSLSSVFRPGMAGGI
jgi:hypothetical protein